MLGKAARLRVAHLGILREEAHEASGIVRPCWLG